MYIEILKHEINSFVVEKHEIEFRVPSMLQNILTFSYYNLSNTGTRKIVAQTQYSSVSDIFSIAALLKKSSV